MDFAWKINGQEKIINNLIDLKNRDILPNSFKNILKDISNIEI